MLFGRNIFDRLILILCLTLKSRFVGQLGVDQIWGRGARGLVVSTKLHIGQMVFDEKAGHLMGALATKY